MALTQKQQSFVERVGKAAAADMARSRVLASLTTAQAILESGWGSSALATKACALFGIKVGTGWTGRVFNTKTQECFDGANLVTVTALFRAYKTWEESIADHSRFLCGATRYAAVVGETDYKKACRAVKAAGYATAPDYDTQLIRVIEQYGLIRFDTAEAGKGNADMRIQPKRVFLGVGHGGADPGAVAGGLRESEVNLNIALRAKEILEYHGVVVGISRTREENDPLTDEIRECNAFRPDLAAESHANAGGGDGCEFFYQTNRYMAQSLALAKAIEVEVMRIGQNTRGCKTRKNPNGTDYFGWCRQVKCPAVLCEAFFLDSSDREIGDTLTEQEAFGVAYARGILKTLGIVYKGSPPGKPAALPAKPTATGKQDAFAPYEIQIISPPVNIRKEPGIDRAIVGRIADKGRYTIVAEAAAEGAKLWGKLKSGAGWISLDYSRKVKG